MSRLEDTIQTLKTYIGEGVETALDYLEKILAPDSQRYNDFIQIKSRYNSLQRELLLGVLEHSTYDISRNNISKALLLLSEEITEKDLRPESGGPAPEEDKRGEILYNVPDLMQLEHEEKCMVRIAFDVAHLKEGWEDSKEDVIKNIRVSEIMAVALLNVDENDPPFTIRTLSETVQFVDKDDFTEWVFYVKPLKTGQFPLLLRVSVIEMINNKEYKKDIVLEEEITVQADAVPPQETTEMKSAGNVVVGNNPLPPENVAPPAAQAQEAGKKGFQRVAGALVTAAALAASGWFGYQYVQQEQAIGNAKKCGTKDCYEDYLKRYPDGRHSEEARMMIDSLSKIEAETLPADTSILETDASTQTPTSMDTSTSENGDKTLEDNNLTTTSSNTKDVSAKKDKKETRKNDPKKIQQKNKTNTGVAVTEPSKEPLPPPVPTAPLLRGEKLYFKIPRFGLTEQEEQYLGFTFYQFNEYREVLAILNCLGESRLKPGTILTFVPDKGEALVAELKYVSQISEVKDRFDGYFTLTGAELSRLASEKFKSVRFLDAEKQVTKTYSFTRKGSKDLNRRAKEALGKLEEKK